MGRAAGAGPRCQERRGIHQNPDLGRKVVKEEKSCGVDLSSKRLVQLDLVAPNQVVAKEENGEAVSRDQP